MISGSKQNEATYLDWLVYFLSDFGIKKYLWEVVSR